MDFTNDVFEAVVIGAGVIGSATAYYLAKEFGNKTLLLEQFDFLHRRGSSHGESRIIRYTYGPEHYTFLMKYAYPSWKAAETEAETQVLRKTGGLDFGRKTNPDLVSVISSAKKWDIPIEVLDPDQVTQKFPRVTLPDGYMAIYSADSGCLNATKSVSMFQILAKQNGCQLMDNVKIVNIKVKKADGENLFEIQTNSSALGNDGKIYSKKCVITGGAWTQKILSSVTTELDDGSEEQLNLKLPLNVIQTTVAYYAVDNPEEFCGRQGKFPVFISYEDNFIYGTPALEYPSMMKCGLHGGPDTDPDERDFLPYTEGINKVVGPFLLKMFKGVHENPSRTESCMYTNTPDDDFILDKIPGIDGLIVGCGFSGHGFKLAPIVGQILTGLAIKGQSPFPSVQQHFELSRF